MTRKSLKKRARLMQSYPGRKFNPKPVHAIYADKDGNEWVECGSAAVYDPPHPLIRRHWERLPDDTPVTCLLCKWMGFR